MTDPSASPPQLTGFGTGGIPSEVPTYPFAPVLAGFLQLVDDSAAKPGKLQASFKELKRDAIRDFEAVCEWAKVQTEDRLLWLIGELALDSTALKATKGRSVLLLRTDQTIHQSQIALSNTVQVSAKSMDKEFRTGAKTRRELLRDLNLAETSSSLFWNEPPGVWPIDAAASAPNEELAPLLDATITRFAFAGLRLAVETQTRREIIELARADKERAARIARKSKLGLRSLAGALRETIDIAVRNDPSDAVQRDYRRRLIESIGKKPDVWHAIDKDRRLLFASRDLVGPSLTFWADIAALTWVSTAKSVEALSELNGAQLAALFAAASQHTVLSLRTGILETIPNLSSEILSGLNWSIFEQYAKQDAVVRRWYNSVRSNSEGTDPLAYTGDAKTDDQSRELKVFVQRCAETELASRDWQGVIAGMTPSATLPGLALLIGRFEKLVINNELTLHSQITDGVRKSAMSIERATEKFKRALGGEPTNLTRSTAEASSRLRKLAEEFEINAESDSMRIKSRSGTAEEDELEAPDSSSDLLELLRNLESQAVKPHAQARADRSRAKAALQHALSGDMSKIDEVVLNSDSLPAEAIGLLWDTAIRRGVRSLLETIGPISRAHAWGERIWLDVMLRRAPAIDGGIPVTDDVAEKSKGMMLRRLDELKHRASDPDLTGAGRKISAAADEIRNDLAEVIEDLRKELNRLSDTIREV